MCAKQLITPLKKWEYKEKKNENKNGIMKAFKL